MSAWFVNEMLAHTIAVIKMDKGEFMRGRGWLITDTKAKYVNLTGMRKERIELNGVSENVQIISYESLPYNGISCSYEGIFSGQGKLIGMNETCGKNPKTGYFDFDRTGKMQYRVRSSGTGSNARRYIRDATSFAKDTSWSMLRTVLFLSLLSICVVITATYLPLRKLTENCGSKAGLVNASSPIPWHGRLVVAAHRPSWHQRQRQAGTRS